MEETTKRVIEFFQFGGLVAFGAIAKYMTDIDSGYKEFNLLSVFFTVFVAFFLGNLIVSFLGADREYLGGILMVAGWGLDKFLTLLDVTTDKWMKKIRDSMGE